MLIMFRWGGGRNGLEFSDARRRANENVHGIEKINTNKMPKESAPKNEKILSKVRCGHKSTFESYFHSPCKVTKS